MPSNGHWSEVKLEDVADAVTVGWVGPMTQEYRDVGVPFLRSLNVKPFRIDRTDIRYVSPEFHARIAKSRLTPGDVVIVRTGDPGTAAVIPEWLPDANCSDLVIVRPGPDLDPWYAAYFINAAAHHQISAHIVGAVQQHFNVGSAKQLRIPLPGISEQKAIVRILGAFDDKIELNRQMNATLEGMARALFKSWFVDFDPVTAKAAGRPPFGMSADLAALFPDSFTDSPLGPIPVGWRAVSLPEAFEVNPTRRLEPKQSAPYLDMQRMPTKTAVPDSWILREAGSGLRFQNGDTLLARITPCLENGKTAFVNFLNEDQIGWGSTEYIVLRSRPPLPLEFSYLLARDEDFRSFAISSMTGSSGRQRVPVNVLDHYNVVVPSDCIAEAFGDIVQPMFTRTLEFAIENRQLSETRDALLPQLLSGEIRLRQAEKLVVEVA